MSPPPPAAVESTINFEGHPSIKSTQDPLVKKLNLTTDTIVRHNAAPPTLYEDGLLEKELPFPPLVLLWLTPVKKLVDLQAIKELLMKKPHQTTFGGSCQQAS